MKLLFYLFSLIVITSSILVVTLKNIMHSALFLALSLVGMAVLFIMLNADFLAVVQILLYAGGIMVLILFAILLTQKIIGTLHPQANEQKTVTIITCLIVFVVLVIAISGTSFKTWTSSITKSGTTELLGKLLLTKYVLPFEVASILILATIVATIIIAKKDE
jgi:NADH-quinone oxidoreductase subunit J